MTIFYKATDRKPLVQAISEFTGEKAIYLKTPTYAYQIGCFTVTREGNLAFDDMADSGEIEPLIKALAQKGFVAEGIDPQEPDNDDEEPQEDEPCGVCISMPRSIFTDNNLENLKAIVAAKGSLIKKALGTDELPIEVTDTKVSFPWFMGTPTPEELKAYDTFICKLCEMARNQKRVNAKEKVIDNEKYAFRCFLLRLGFIGEQYKVERKILLRHLAGSSAFRSVPFKEVEVCE